MNDDQYPIMSPVGQFLGHPGMAMAGAAMQNMSALRRGQPMPLNPVQEMNEQRRRNALLQDARLQMIQSKQEHRQRMQLQAQQLALAAQQHRLAAMKPQLFKSGNNVVSVHPITGQSQLVYEGPEDWEVHGDTASGFWRISPTTGNREQITGPLSPSGFFEGTSMPAQQFNRLLKSVEPERREAVALELITQTLGRPTTYTDATGRSYTQPGIDVPGALAAGAPVDVPTDASGQGAPPPRPTVSVAEPEPSQGERTAYSYYTRMAEAERRLQQLFDEYPEFDPTADLQAQTGRKLADFMGSDAFKSDEWQRFDAGLRDWTAAKLRKESGAAIPPEELQQEIERYFPRYGTTPGARRDLQAARLEALKALRQEAGRAYGQDTERAPLGLYWSPSVGIISEADIEQTLKEEGITREQLFERLQIEEV